MLNQPESPQSGAQSAPPERERILAVFAQWLDCALEEEPAPALPTTLLAALENGDPLPPLENSEAGCDLYTLWSSMTALTQEVRLQGRQFKLLHETLQSTTLSRADESGPSRPHIDVLLDMHERLERTVSTARAAAADLASSRPPLIARWIGGAGRAARKAQDLAESLVEGNSLTLDQLDEALRNLGVSRIVCLNRPFDPRSMTAVAVESTNDVAEGTVVEIFRNGYEWNGEVYRTAQVKVARKREGAKG